MSSFEMRKAVLSVHLSPEAERQLAFSMLSRTIDYLKNLTIADIDDEGNERDEEAVARNKGYLAALTVAARSATEGLKGVTFPVPITEEELDKLIDEDNIFIELHDVYGCISYILRGKMRAAFSYFLNYRLEQSYDLFCKYILPSVTFGANP